MQVKFQVMRVKRTSGVRRVDIFSDIRRSEGLEVTLLACDDQFANFGAAEACSVSSIASEANIGGKG